MCEALLCFTTFILSNYTSTVFSSVLWCPCHKILCSSLLPFVFQRALMIYLYYFYVFTNNDDLQMILVPFSSNTTGITRGAWTTAGYHFKAPEFTPVFIGVCDAQSLGISVMFCGSLFFILSFFQLDIVIYDIAISDIVISDIIISDIVLSDIWLPFGAFVFFLKIGSLSKVFNWSFVSNPLHTSLFQSVHFQQNYDVRYNANMHCVAY
jgi:hypothetical protein